MEKIQVDIKAGSILIVDDIMDNLNMLADLLEEQGHTVRIAMHGKAALQSVQEDPPDVILLDIQMPGMNGYEVCERLKADEQTRDIPIIFLSALSETSDILKGFEAGGIDYVSKPFQFREVVARVNSQLTLAHQRREIAALREKDQQQFEQLSKMKDRFLHATAHDLKNPLTGVLLYSQLLRTLEENELDRLDEVADGIEGSARKMQRLITDILDLAQMQIGDNLSLHPTDVRPLLEKAVQDNRILAQEQKIQISLEIPDEKIILHLDNHQFERVMDNLISNALKYTQEGGDVRVWLRPKNGYVEIAVEDSGIGIPEEDIPHLFEAFYRVRKPSHKKMSGTGLGLSIVDAIVQQHGGELALESEVGKGSVFFVRLPSE